MLMVPVSKQVEECVNFIADTLTSKLAPGLCHAFSSFYSPERVNAVLTVEMARAVKALISEGTPESLMCAMQTIENLRKILFPRACEGSLRTIITEAHGIFIGKDELLKLNRISPDEEIPAIPEKFSPEFFAAIHPIRGGSIGSHCILAYDRNGGSGQWHCIDRGNGGESDIVPGSLGIDGQGLAGHDQDKLLQVKGKQIDVGGLEISSPVDSCAIERVLDSAIALHLSENKSKETFPFKDLSMRTADTINAAPSCRAVLACSSQTGTSINRSFHNFRASSKVGLIAEWS